MYKLIKCNICYREFNGQISGSHLKTHGTNVQEYELIYGPSRDPQLILDAKSGGGKRWRESSRKEFANLKK